MSHLIIPVQLLDSVKNQNRHHDGCAKLFSAEPLAPPNSTHVGTSSAMNKPCAVQPDVPFHPLLRKKTFQLSPIFSLPVRYIAQVALRMRMGHFVVFDPGNGELVCRPRQTPITTPSFCQRAARYGGTLRGLLLQQLLVGSVARRSLFLCLTEAEKPVRTKIV